MSRTQLSLSSLVAGDDFRGRDCLTPHLDTVADQCQSQPRKRHQRGYPGNSRESRATVDDHAAQPGADGIAEIEGGDVETRGKALAGALRLFQHPHLQRRHGGKGRAPSRPIKIDNRKLAVDGKAHESEHQLQEQTRLPISAGISQLIGELATGQDCRPRDPAPKTSIIGETALPRNRVILVRIGAI